MGPNYSISTACATSNFCILNAANHIIRGEAVSLTYCLHFWVLFYQHIVVDIWRTYRIWCFVVALMLLSYRLVLISSFCIIIIIILLLKNISMCYTGAGLGGFVACKALSQRNSDPAKASRPWDSVMILLPPGFYLTFCSRTIISVLKGIALMI